MTGATPAAGSAMVQLEAAFGDLDTARDGLLGVVDMLQTVALSPPPHQLAAVLGLVAERLTLGYQALYGSLDSGDRAGGPHSCSDSQGAGS